MNWLPVLTWLFFALWLGLSMALAYHLGRQSALLESLSRLLAKMAEKAEKAEEAAPRAEDKPHADL